MRCLLASVEEGRTECVEDAGAVALQPGAEVLAAGPRRPGLGHANLLVNHVHIMADTQRIQGKLGGHARRQVVRLRHPALLATHRYGGLAWNARVTVRFAGAAGREGRHQRDMGAGTGCPPKSDSECLEQAWLLADETRRDVIDLGLDAEAVQSLDRAED